LVITVEDFITYLKTQNPTRENLSWEGHFLPRIVKIVKDVLKKSQEVIEPRANSFELFGFDFAVSKNLDLWLLEVNMSPACSERQIWLTEMLDDMANGVTRMISAKIAQTEISLGC
jgi:hypothetical protein